MVSGDVMGICLLSFMTAAMVVFSHIQEHSATDTYQVCRRKGETFVCNSSLILITNITNLEKQDDLLFFENLKRNCMGRNVCDPSRVCENVNRRSLTVHYMCVDNTYIRSRSCNERSEKMTHNFGYILSAGYPAATGSRISCRWTIDVPHDQAVVVLLHDFVTNYGQHNCETRLEITGTSCHGDSREDVYWCGNDNITSLTRCGETQILFVPSKNNDNVRYWLSFCVLQRDQISTFSRSTQHCPRLSHNVPDTGSKDISGANSQDSNTEVLVIMLSIISGISTVLLIILIVVCVRWRRARSPGAESVYSDASPSVQPHYEYVSTSDIENARPHLADGYSEKTLTMALHPQEISSVTVADALPFVKRSRPQTSPPYDEVDHIAEIRNVAHLISSDEYPRASKRGERPCDSGVKNNKNNQRDNIHASSESSQAEQRGILDAFKDASSKRKYVNTASNTDQQTISNCVAKETKHKNTPVSSQTMLSTQSNSDNDSSTYETIGKSPAVKACLQSNKWKHPDSEGVPSDMYPRSVSTTESCSKMLQVIVSDNANSIAASDGRSYTRCPHTSDQTYYILEKKKKSTCRGGKSEPTDKARTRSKSLPSGKSVTCLPDSATTKQHKRTAFKDIPPASGIVRNGIMKFEQNSA